jgi:hypothetical protein
MKDDGQPQVLHLRGSPATLKGRKPDTLLADLARVPDHQNNPEYEKIYPPPLISIDYRLDTREGDYYSPGEYDVSAFTTAELGERLPTHFHTTKTEGWEFGDSMCTLEGVEHQEVADTEADARAKMLVYLLENAKLKS